MDPQELPHSPSAMRTQGDFGPQQPGRGLPPEPVYTGALILNSYKKTMSRNIVIGHWAGGKETMWAGQMEGERKQQQQKGLPPRERDGKTKPVN